MSVNLSRYDRAVTQQLLYVSDIHILFKKQGGEGVPLRYNYDKPGKP